MTEPPDAPQPQVPETVPPEETPQPEAIASELVEDAEDDAAATALAETNRLFGLLTLGIMALLLLCVVLVLIADRRAPAGL
jgi:hypothetical protein